MSVGIWKDNNICGKCLLNVSHYYNSTIWTSTFICRIENQGTQMTTTRFTCWKFISCKSRSFPLLSRRLPSPRASFVVRKRLFSNFYFLVFPAAHNSKSVFGTTLFATYLHVNYAQKRVVCSPTCSRQELSNCANNNSSPQIAICTQIKLNIIYKWLRLFSFVWTRCANRGSHCYFEPCYFFEIKYFHFMQTSR